MAESVEVSCINKRGDHFDPHERISHIGGVHAGKRWRLTEADAIQSIKSGKYAFYVSQGGRTVAVVIAKHNGREYLKTEADGYRPDNLLSLNECPLS